MLCTHSGPIHSQMQKAHSHRFPTFAATGAYSACENCESELPIPESGRGGMGAGQGEELRKQEVVCWVPIGWRSRMMHSRAWGLRRQGTLAQIFPAPHFFFFFC